MKDSTMRVSELPRPSPERLLKQVQAEENKRWGAKLKIFLGYAPGVGKSYRMLDEARRRHERGEDVIVGAVHIGYSAHNSWRDRLFGDPVLRLIRAAEGIDVRVFPY